MASPTLEGLQKGWPGWKLWRTETMWNATRRGPKPEMPAGFSVLRGYLALTLLEEGPHELLAALKEQVAIEEEIAASLDLGQTGEAP